MPDRSEEIAKKLRTALREQTRERRALDGSVSLGVQRAHAVKYVAAHLRVKTLRGALMKEAELMEQPLDDILKGD